MGLVGGASGSRGGGGGDFRRQKWLGTKMGANGPIFSTTGHVTWGRERKIESVSFVLND